MSKPKNSNVSTLATALILCLICSVLVSVAPVSLKQKQLSNVQIDRNKNILMAANLFDPTKDAASVVEERFKNVETKIINTQSGAFATEDELTKAGITNIDAYDPAKAAKSDELGVKLGDDDPARVGAVPKYAKVYLLKDESGKIKNIILPINGYGLWGQIYGFITLQSDINTIEGISFYQHKETPGLGALIEEADWRAKWNGAKTYNDSFDKVTIGVSKAGSPQPGKIDGISGATLTTAGVNNMVQFWLGERAFKPFLDNLRNGKEG